MIINESLFVYAALLVGLLLLFEGALQFFGSLVLKAEKDPARRLLADAAGRKARDAAVSVRRDGTAAGGLAMLRPLRRLIQEADADVSTATLLLMMVGMGMVPLVVFSIVWPGLPAPVVLLVSAAVGVTVPVAWLLNMRSVRMDRLEAQLPDALELIIRGLKVGHPVSASMALVAEQMPAPIGKEFALVVAETKYGREVPDAIARLTERVKSPDFKFLAMVIQIQYAAGGNLAEILQTLAGVIRDRFRMYRKVKALTSEGRMTAWFVSLFPVLMFFVLQLIKPDYYSQVYDFEYFNQACVLILILLVANVAAMKMITRIKV